MRRKRAIESSIGMDEDIAKLTDFEARVYMFGLPHTDNFGRFIGDGPKFKMLVDPLSPHKPEEYEPALNRLAELGLISRYKVNDKWYIQYKQVSFDRINKFFVKRRGIPEFPGQDEIEDSKDSIDQVMYNAWGRVWTTASTLVKMRMVELYRIHGYDKFVGAVEYSATRNAMNLAYVKAVLEGQKVDEKKTEFKKRNRDAE
jgi:hypothetical protein